MPVVDATGLIPDRWTAVADGTPLPAAGAVLVGPERAEAALAAGLSTGVLLPNHADPAAAAPLFPRLGLVAVAFPSFADGRGFSLGRALRRLGWAGRLRASGPVIADQFADLIACGYDEVAVPDAVLARQPVAQWLARVARPGLGYQRGLAGRGSILDRRAGTG